MSSAEERVARIRAAIEDAFIPHHLHIADDSHRHAGHTGARGGGHYTVTIVAQAFQDKSLLERHRMVYDVLRPLLKTDIHALSIKASTPQESRPT